MMTRFFAATLLALGLLPTAVAAEDEHQSPESLVRETTTEVLDVLEANKEQISEDPAQVYDHVAELVLPHFDFRLMSRFVLGRHWNQASEAQSERFVEEFRGLLIRTYGTSLTEYSGQEVDFPPMQSDPGNGRVTVPTEILQGNGPRIPVHYRLHRTDSGRWKVFDVVIEGVSLVQNYRSTFSSEINRNGMDALIERLDKRNAERGILE